MSLPGQPVLIPNPYLRDLLHQPNGSIYFS